LRIEEREFVILRGCEKNPVIVSEAKDLKLRTRNAAVSAAERAASRRPGRRDGARSAGEDAGVPSRRHLDRQWHHRARLRLRMTGFLHKRSG
jgi:hypothetical protein